MRGAKPTEQRLLSSACLNSNTRTVVCAIPDNSKTLSAPAATHSTVALPTDAFRKRIATLAQQCRSRVTSGLPEGAAPAEVLEAVSTFLQRDCGFQLADTGRSALPEASVVDHRALPLLANSNQLPRCQLDSSHLRWKHWGTHASRQMVAELSHRMAAVGHTCARAHTYQ